MKSWNWKEVIQQWRSLPEEEKRRRRWERIPRSVAESMVFEKEPVDLSMLEAEHARRPMPPVVSKPDSKI